MKCFKIFVLLLITVLNFSTTELRKLKANNEKQPSPKIEVLIESLCPDCIRFFRTSFVKLLQNKNINELSNVVFHSYGNAKEQFNQQTGLWSFTCQHGENECYGNLIQTCFLKKITPQTIVVSYNILYCMYDKIFSMGRNFDKTFEHCVGENLKSTEEKNKFIKTTFDCVNSKEGNLLQHEVAQVHPVHRHVPWVVVNGNRDETTEKKVTDNLVKFVCDSSNSSWESCKGLGKTEYTWEKFNFDSSELFLEKKRRCVNKFYHKKHKK